MRTDRQPRPPIALVPGVSAPRGPDARSARVPPGSAPGVPAPPGPDPGARRGAALRSPSLSPQELAGLFDEFSRTTGRLQESHRRLESRVAELRRQLAEKDRQLERKKRLEALGLMVAGVAHEVRNPLGGISLYLDCLTQEVRGGPSRDECLRLIGRIEESVSHLNAVVETMLVFARSSPADPRECDLSRLVDESLQLLRSDIEKGSVRIERQPESFGDAGAPVVRGDPDQIRCVFLNVIKNAIEAMDGGGTVAIRFDPGPAGGPWSWLVSIRDTGGGIPEENIEKVFVPFFSAGKKKGGIGLGLTIVHSLMEKHGGAVDLENAAGGGLEVRIRFPADFPPAPGDAAGRCVS